MFTRRINRLIVVEVEGVDGLTGGCEALVKILLEGGGLLKGTGG